MGTTSKNIQAHEEILVQDSETDDRIHLVRPERFGPGHLVSYLKISGNNFEILNYSAFGIAVVADSTTKYGMDLVAGEFWIGSTEVQELDLKFAYMSPLGDGKIKVAFEIHGRPLNVEKASSVVEAASVSQSFVSRMEEDDGFDPEFRRAVLEAKDFLTELKNSLDEVEASWGQISPEIKKSREQGMGIVISDFLTHSLHRYYEAIAKSMKDVPVERRVAYFTFFRKKLSHLILGVPFVNRAYTKPLGYAGDFEMMNLIYRNDFEGNDLFSKCLHKYYIDQSAAKAVKNRARYLLGKIENSAKEFQHDGPVNILSVASGPSLEIQEYLRAQNANVGPLSFTMLDQDLKALQHSQHKIRELCLQRNIKNCEFSYQHSAIKNLVIKGTGKVDYYHLIYSAGLFDYLSDTVAIATMKQLYSSLKPGGRLVVGNFDIFPNRPHMEMALDWHLIVRTKEDLGRLGLAVSPSPLIESEPEKINLFLVIQKPKRPE